MPRYKATTESGAQYVIDTDELWWTKNDGSQHPLSSFMTPNRRMPDGRYAGWGALAGEGSAEAPVVGRSIYVQGSSFEDAYLSTDVVSVEVLS